MHLTTTAVTLARKAHHRHLQAQKLTQMSVNALAKGEIDKAIRFRNKAIRSRVWKARYEKSFTIRYQMEKDCQSVQEG